MRGLLLRLGLLLVLAGACGGGDDDGGEVPGTPDATPVIDAPPAFTPRSGLYSVTSENSPDMATPTGCSLAPTGVSAPTFISVSAGADTLTLSLFGDTTVCVRTGQDFVCPTTVFIDFPNNAETRDFVTITGTFSDEENWTSDNSHVFECTEFGANGCGAQESVKAVTEFPCAFPSTSSAAFDRP